jgi:uncharacterized cupin superfamily protein
MPKIFHLNEIPLTKRNSRILEYAWHTSAGLEQDAKSKHLLFSIRSLDPGMFSYPYHFHRTAEELFAVFSGEATLRSPEGFVKIRKEDIVYFEEGPAGAHQVYNHGETPFVYLDIRTLVGLDVCEYPDSGKVNILPAVEIYEKKSRVDYYQGEEDVYKNWPADLIKEKKDRRR